MEVGIMWIMCESEKGLEISASICISLSVCIILYDTQILVVPFQFLALNASSIYMSQDRFIARISRHVETYN